MVYTERANMAAVSRGTSHVSAVSTPLRWISKTHYEKANHSCQNICECMRAENISWVGAAISIFFVATQVGVGGVGVGGGDAKQLELVLPSFAKNSYVCFR